MFQTDVLVIGSGIAGLTYALKVSEWRPNLKITIVTKSDDSESNTRYAQGGIAVVRDKVSDSFEQHIEDTLRAGDGLCKRPVVEMVVREAPERLDEIIAWGAAFDQEENGHFSLGREGGHSANRILHHKDMTGFEIEKTLLARIEKSENVELVQHFFALDLIMKEAKQGRKKCCGAQMLNEQNGKVENIFAKTTMLATGGIGQVYSTTTNPAIATGDGIAMAHRAGAKIENMEFIQFHPTALYQPGISPAFLISEAVRGFGAKLKTKDGKPFMHHYDEREELASRDIVARAIFTEMQKHNAEHVYLDCRDLNAQKFEQHFPNIIKTCAALGFHWQRDLIPVAPAAHYCCGGIATNIHGETSISNLYACGEFASTGLHGANRLASNSLLEALVFAHHSALRTIENSGELADFQSEIVRAKIGEVDLRVLARYKRKIQQIMVNSVGIVRSDEQLHLAKNKIYQLEMKMEKLFEKDSCSIAANELRNLCTVAQLIIEHSLDRRENKGVHFNQDRVKVTDAIIAEA